MPQTSDRVSSLAARHIRINGDTLLALTSTPELRENLAREIRIICASALAQDEHRGLRGLIRKVMG